MYKRVLYAPIYRTAILQSDWSVSFHSPSDQIPLNVA